MFQSTSTLVVTATYNEIDNLPRLVEAIFQHAPEVEVLVIDDNSPDGTGRWCDERAATDARVRVLHRPAKLGLGTAIVAGLHFALEHGYRFALVMDADFSHHPRYLPDFFQGMESPEDQPPLDVMIGSRYTPGGGVEGWPWRRRWMSRSINWYARLLLGLTPRDCSGGFRCYRLQRVRQIDLAAICARGYAFQEEILWRLKRVGARFGETPIMFVDRERGRSKLGWREEVSALWILFRLGMQNWLGR